MADDYQEANSWDEVPASKILEQIQKSELVDYDHKIIKGNLDLNLLNLPKIRINNRIKEKNINEDLSEYVVIIASIIKISNSRIDGNVNFANVILKCNNSFEGSRFEGRAFFMGTRFEGESNFAHSTFKEYADFTGSRFSRVAAFGRSQFLGNTVMPVLTGTPPHLSVTGEIHLGSASFSNSYFCSIALFDHSRFSSRVYFSGAQFEGQAAFDETQFEGQSLFVPSKFKGRADFNGTKFCEGAGFYGSCFSEDAYFIGAQLKNASFDQSQFSGDVHFERAQFDSFGISRSRFSGDVLTFRDALFKYAKSQENACRRAKNVLERSGDRDEAGYHFYREMEGKRKQKAWYFRYPEYIFIQLIFGYGVRPFQLWLSWFVFVGAFAFLYWLGHGIDITAPPLNGNATAIDYIWFSIATGITPGYAGYKPIPDFKLIAGFEAILGTFMWAAFIATFARKFMR